MTNREWINGLSNKQMVKFMRTFFEEPCELCAYNDAEECGYCFDGHVAWLDQEHVDSKFEELDQRYCLGV